jgi:hypothetical protein
MWLIALAGGAALAWASRALKERRRREFSAFARQFDLDYAPHEVTGLVALPFELFGRGDTRRCENVVRGTWKGAEVTAFDFSYAEEHEGASGRRSRTTTHRFSCAVVGTDAACSPLAILPETALTRLADGLGFRDIEFESGEFNEAFDVRSVDRKFASDFVDARMMRWLLDHGRGYAFEACGRWLLAYTRRLRPFELLPLLGTVKGFADNVPRLVRALYGAAGQPLV